MMQCERECRENCEENVNTRTDVENVTFSFNGLGDWTSNNWPQSSMH